MPNEPVRREGPEVGFTVRVQRGAVPRITWRGVLPAGSGNTSVGLVSSFWGTFLILRGLLGPLTDLREETG